MARCLAGPLSRHGGLAVGLLCALSQPAWGQAAAPGADIAASAPDIAQDFDIPSQPLAAALDQYASVARVSVGTASEMVRGRVSTAVRGRFSPDEALRRLLVDTGLTAERQGDAQGASYFLTRTAAPSAGRAALASQPGYTGAVQTRIWEVLCADPRTTPGDYRLVFRFQIDNAGHLTSPYLYVSTGDSRRDAAVLAALQRVQVSPPPPALLQQSVLMTVLPGQAAGAMRCPQGAH